MHQSRTRKYYLYIYSVFSKTNQQQLFFLIIFIFGFGRLSHRSLSLSKGTSLIRKMARSSLESTVYSEPTVYSGNGTLRNYVCIVYNIIKESAKIGVYASRLTFSPFSFLAGLCSPISMNKKSLTSSKSIITLL